MPQYPMMQVDAFTTQRLAGNPCAIVFEADNLTDDLMQAIALENNLSETSFVMQSNQADFKVRYFTPASEIPMAGHPTIATTHALIERGHIKLGNEPQTITLEMKAGIIPVEISKHDDLIRITMTQNPPQFFATYEPEAVMPAMGLSVDDVLEGYPIQTVSTGTKHLMIPLKSQDALRRATLNHSLYRALREQGDFFGGPHLFCLQGATDKGLTFARHPGLPPDTHEDPFTGSSTGSMASYLWRYGLLEKPTFIAEQGHWMNRPGAAYVEVLGSRENITGVRVGGEAVTVLDGMLMI